MIRFSRRTVFVTAVLGGTILLPARASAQTPDLTSARVAFVEAMELRAKGLVAESLPKFEAAHANAQTPVTTLELGRTYMLLGRLVEAYEMFMRVGRMRQEFEETERSAKARAEAPVLAASVEPRIPSLKIVLKLPPEATAKVFVDGALIPPAALTTPRKVNPGRRVVTAKAGDGPETRIAVELAEGQSTEVTLAPSWVPPRVDEAEGTRTIVYTQSTNPLAYIGFATAGIFFGTSIFAGTLAYSKTRDFEEQCQSYGDRRACPPGAEGTRDDAQTFATVANVSIVVALAGATVGLWGLLHPTRSPKQTAVFFGPGLAGAAGRF